MTSSLDRRAFVGYFSTVGLSGTLLPGVLWAQARQQQAARVTKDMIAQAEKVAGLEFTDAEREEMVRGLDQNLNAWEQLRATAISNAVVPALLFDPVPGITPDDAVRAAVADAQRAAGRDYVDPSMPLPFATDFAAITRRVPGALIGLGRPGGWSFHTPEGAAQFASEAGVAAALDVATVLALSAVRLGGPR